MTKNEFMSPSWDKYNANETEEIQALRKIVFHLIREIQVLRETHIQSSVLKNELPKNTLYGKLYKEICIESYNSAGLFSGEDKILFDWFNRENNSPDEIIMLKKLGYTPEEIEAYLRKIDEVGCYT